MRLRFQLDAEHDAELGRTDSISEKSIITMNHDKDFCSQFTFTINDMPLANKIQSLPIQLTAQLLETSAALSPYSESNITRYIHFDKHCGRDDKCISDLKITGTSNVPSIMYGPETTVDLDIVISNRGENSYGSYLYVMNEDYRNYRFQTGLLVTDSKKSVLNCDEPDDGVSRCPIGNPLGDHDEINVKLRYRIWPAWSKDRTTFTMVANNTNEPTQTSNNLVLTVPHGVSVKLKHNVEIDPYFVTYSKSDDFGQFVWRYNIQNNGPSTVNGDVSIKFPAFTKGGRKLLNVESVSALRTTKTGEVQPINCTVPTLFSRDIVPFRIDDFKYKMIDNFRHYGCRPDNCKGDCAAICIDIECQTAHFGFEKSDRISVNVTSQLNHR